MGTKTNPEAHIEVFVFNLEVDRSALLINSLVVSGDSLPRPCVLSAAAMMLACWLLGIV